MIVAAAIQINNLTMSMRRPARHHDILRQWIGIQEEVLNNESERIYVKEIQGFIDDRGNFLNRCDAMKHAIDCGQGLPRRRKLQKENSQYNYYDGIELYSEDLW